MKKAYLYLENGQVLEGRSFGAAGTAMGELVFTTGMTGCVESLTDPSYYGQLVVYTFPQFGNYGICRADQESPHCQMGGVVVREACENPSNFRCEETVDAFLKEENVVGIAGVDTRMLTQMIRDGGVLNAVITTEEGEPDWDALKAYRVKESVENTSRKDILVRHPEGEKKFSVALLDYGAKGSICNSLLARGCEVTIYPYNTPAEDILAAGHDGVMLSNGPGDPADNPFCIQQIQKLFGKLPMFGICLGHQIMALAAGAKTKKLKFGHRGANQPAMRPGDRHRGHHQPEPRLRRGRDHPGRHGGKTPVRQRQRRHLRGRRLPRLPRLLPAVPPRGPRRPLGHLDRF